MVWVTLAVRWFDPGAALRPAWLDLVPALVLALPTAALAALWLGARREALWGQPVAGPRGGLLLVVGLALLFRWPLLWQGAVGYLTPDGALSGIVALRLRSGLDHLVFVPSVPYSGSLKSHVAAALMPWMDGALAFAVASLLFYGLFVAGLYRLALLASEGRPFVPVAAGLYAAFAPAFVTRYSLSNDGNYVEVLALGAWALVLAVRWVREPDRTGFLSLLAGLLLGLAFWCHILAVIPAAAFAVIAVAAHPRRALRAVPWSVWGWILGYLPGLLWNAGHGWESFLYVLPGGQTVGSLDRGPSLLGRALTLVTDHGPVLFGYDFGYPAPVDVGMRALAWGGLAVATVGFGLAVPRALRSAASVDRALVVFTLVNGAVALLALPAIPGNPRYLLFLMTAVPILLARTLERARPLMVVLVLFGVLGSLGQAPAAARSDAQWRRFVAALEAEGVGFCSTDFFIAAKVNFLSSERIVCSSSLGPTSTEYFKDDRERVDRASDVALVAVNPTAADKIGRRLARLGVGYERKDLMKPVFLRLTRKVRSEELFPEYAATP